MTRPRRCKCGFLGSRVRPCACTDGSVAQYRGRLSGPFLDRLDLRVDVPSLTFEEISARAPGESSAAVRERVRAARGVQLARQAATNSQLGPARLRSSLTLDTTARKLLSHAVDRFGISARAHDRTLRVALTIRDLDDLAHGRAALPWPVELRESQIAEALSYRQVDPNVVVPFAPQARADRR